jgi:hypothetical protein
VPLGAGEVKVTPPSAGDDVDSEEDSDEEEEDDHPLSREELKAKTLRNLARRESMDRDGGTEIRKTPKRRSVN